MNKISRHSVKNITDINVYGFIPFTHRTLAKLRLVRPEDLEQSGYRERRIEWTGQRST